jgi:membrane protease YdiL (CAAX protease family)
MGNTASPRKTFLLRLLTLAFVLLCGLFVTFLLYFAVLLLQKDLDIASIEQNLKAFVMTAGQIRILQTLQTFCIFILPPFVLCQLFAVEHRNFLSLRLPGWKEALMGIVSMVVMMPFLNVLVAWNAGLHLPEAFQGLEQSMRASEDASAVITDRLMAGTTAIDLGLNLLVVAVLAGIGEELFFRGLLLRMLTDAFKTKDGNDLKPWARHLSIWVIAIVFSAIHNQFFGFFPRMVLGAWFGYLLWFTGSIWVPVFAHFTNNALSTIVVFAQNKGMLTDDPDRWGMDGTWWLSILSLALTTVTIWYFVRFRAKKQ